MLKPRTDRLLVAVSLLLLLAGAGIEHFHPELKSVADTVAVGAVALMALGGGWIGGAIALFLAPLLLLPEPTPHLIGEWVEWVVVVTVMLLARRSMLQLQRAEQAVQRSNEELEERVKERTRELRNSEERYRSVFDQAQEVIFCITREGILTSLNPAFERVLGWQASEWIGKHFMGLVPADAQSQAADLFSRLLSDGKLDVMRFVVLARNGNRVAFEICIVEQILNNEGVGFLGVARDTTEREQAADALRRSERQLAEAQAVAKLGSWEHDLKTGTIWWSDEAYRAFGLQPDTKPMTFEQFLEIIRPGDRQLVADFRSALYLKGEHAAEVELRTSSGEKHVFSCQARLIRDEHGVAHRVIGTTQEVTESKRREEMLRESEERFRLLARATSDAVWDINLLTGMIWRGEGYKTLFGYPSGETEISRTAWFERIHPDDRSRVDQSVHEAIESGQTSWSAEYRVLRADGSHATVINRAYIVRDDQKRPTRMLGAMMDLTERKQMEEQLEQAKRVSSLGRVAASIAHEFNNVLMGIQPNVEVIQRSSPRGLRTVTSNILHAVQRGKRITDEILRFTRPAEPNFQCLSVEEFFERWKSEVEPLLSSNIDLRFDTGSDVYVLADPLQLSQVFTNLALNARDAMEGRRGKVTVGAHLSKSFGSFPFGVVQSPDRFIHFRVTDEGCGIAEERLGHIFEPLFTTKKGGIGLGLAIAYQIVMRHNGHIFVESEPGKGSTFHMFIPATSPLVHESAPEGKTSDLELRRVLLVEDEPSVAAGMAMLFEMEGVDVVIAATGRESIPTIEKSLPDAVVLDIGLPDMDGVGVYQEIERRWPTLPVLFSSGHGDSAKLEKYLARPNVGFILKPYEYAAMRAELSRLLGARVAAAC